MEHRDVFLLLGELAIAFAGFAGVVIVFRERDRESWSGRDRSAFRGMLRNSLAAGLFAVLPFPLFAFGFTGGRLWSVLSGLLALHLFRSLYIVSMILRDVPEVSLRSPELALSSLGLLVALLLQLGNLPTQTSYHGAAPYLAGVCWLVMTAGITFWNLVMRPVQRGGE
jgi:hypothetical protein